ncbi:hypothetical protein GCM10010274_60110 [Streptomyces lavendofoliae]|uniref:Uncharacterized protein n=1 Tax=Streptomyces lavendofoliae TaxID=67314 RepID=A0A918I3H9_9ACTN|nr:hypothetical protein GCM10010274_60110 [Streptomyces lavendofoliae]
MPISLRENGTLRHIDPDGGLWLYGPAPQGCTVIKPSWLPNAPGLSPAGSRSAMLRAFTGRVAFTVLLARLALHPAIASESTLGSISSPEELRHAGLQLGRVPEDMGQVGRNRSRQGS